MTKAEAMRQTRQLDVLRELGFTFDEAETLRRISMTLRRWFELECGNSDDYASWCIVRGSKSPRVHQRDPETQASIWVGGEFTHDDNGAPWMERHAHDKPKATYSRIPDRERGAMRRLEAIIAACNKRKTESGEHGAALGYYIQGDPRGAALYILRPGDIPDGKDANGYYSRGICVY